MRQIYSFVQIWRYIYYSKHALSNKPSFSRCSGFPAGHAFKNLHQTHVRKCKNAMPKSRQNLSSLLSIVDYMFFNLFLVVHLRKKYYFGKEKQYSTQNSVFLERFYRKSGSPDSLYGKCRNDFDMIRIELICTRRRCWRRGGGGTPLYGLYRYVRPQRVWFFSRFGHK